MAGQVSAVFHGLWRVVLSRMRELLITSHRTQIAFDTVRLHPWLELNQTRSDCATCFFMPSQCVSEHCTERYQRLHLVPWCMNYTSLLILM